MLRSAGSGDVIVLLNNDAFCRPDFLERVVAAFEDDRVGAVAPLTRTGPRSAAQSPQ